MPVESDLLHERGETCRESHNEIEKPPSEHEPEDAAEHREKRALGEELVNEAASARSDGGAQGELALALDEA